MANRILHTGSMDAQEKRQAIELEILRMIQQKLENVQMDAKRIDEIAKLVLKIFPPGISLERIYQLVTKLDYQFSKLS